MKKLLLILLSFLYPALLISQVRYDNISFLSMPDGLKMSGTLSRPSGQEKLPAIILIWGSGPHTRDQVISKFPMFRLMADYFNNQGYAVLRIDKRGQGASEGPGKSETTATSEDLADDIYSALQFLKSQPFIDSDNIGLIGHSEGAWIGEMVALRDSSVKWLVLLGAHIISGAEVQTDQMCDNLLRLGATVDVVEKVRPQITRYLDFIKAGYSDDSAYYAIGRDFLLAHGMEEKDISNKTIDQFLDGFRTPWNRCFFSNTPGDLIKKLSIPSYFIYGSLDKVVTPKTNILPLLEMMQARNIMLTILPETDHFFQVKAGNAWTLDSRLCPVINTWLRSLD